MRISPWFNSFDHATIALTILRKSHPSAYLFRDQLEEFYCVLDDTLLP